MNKQPREFADLSEVPSILDGVRIWDGYHDLIPLWVAGGLAAIEVQEPMNGGVLFVGDSITQAAPLGELFPEIETRNHGVSADETVGLFMRMSQILRHRPEKLVLKIGTNDIGNRGRDITIIAENIQIFIRAIKAVLPETKIYNISILPREPVYADKVHGANALIKKVAKEEGTTFIDIHSHFDTGDGELIPDFTEDGLHLNDKAYQVLGNVLREWVYS